MKYEIKAEQLDKIIAALEQTEDELYKRVYIKSETDLPEKVGNYPVHQKGFEPDYVMSMYYNGLPNNFWVQAYDWYLLPLEQEPIEKKYYKKVYIKTEADLPKNNTNVYFHNNMMGEANDKLIKTFCQRNKYEDEMWLRDVDWYLLPLEQESKNLSQTYTYICAKCEAVFEDSNAYCNPSDKILCSNCKEQSNEEKWLEENIYPIGENMRTFRIDRLAEILHEYFNQSRKEELIKFAQQFYSDEETCKSNVDNYLKPKP